MKMFKLSMMIFLFFSLHSFAMEEDLQNDIKKIYIRYPYLSSSAAIAKAEEENEVRTGPALIKNSEIIDNDEIYIYMMNRRPKENELPALAKIGEKIISLQRIEGEVNEKELNDVDFSKFPIETTNFSLNTKFIYGSSLSSQIISYVASHGGHPSFPPCLRTKVYVTQKVEGTSFSQEIYLRHDYTPNDSRMVIYCMKKSDECCFQYNHGGNKCFKVGDYVEIPLKDGHSKKGIITIIYEQKIDDDISPMVFGIRIDGEESSTYYPSHLLEKMRLTSDGLPLYEDLPPPYDEGEPQQHDGDTCVVRNIREPEFRPPSMHRFLVVIKSIVGIVRNISENEN